jgi:predicted MFS family arabinose efflux permease
MTATVPAAAPALSPGLLVLLFAVIFASASTIHYQTPMLDLLAKEFGASAAEIGWLPTLTQVGFCLGVAFLTPLGDRFDKKWLIFGRVAGCAVMAIVLATAQSLPVLIAAGLAMGVFASTSQDVVPLVAQLVEPAKRGRAVGTVISGLLLGILSGRVLGGVIAESFGWRAAYWALLALLMVILVLIAWRVPSVSAQSALTYGALLRSIGRIVRDYPQLRCISIVQALIGVCYGSFWATLALMMASVHGLGSTVTGLIGIPGAAGVLFARPIGRWVDTRGPRPAVTLGVTLVLLAYLVLGLAGLAVAVVALGALILDCGIRSAAVSNQAYLTGIDAQARSRMNTVFVLHMFGGNAIGAFVGSIAFARGGWTAVCASGVLFAALALYVHRRAAANSPK